MIKSILLIVLGCICCSCGSGQKTSSTFSHFKVEFIQDGVLKPINNHDVTLLKKSFTIIIYFKSADSIFVNASYKPDCFNAILEQKKLQEIPGFEGVGIQEELFNPDKFINISDTSPNYWYYNSHNEHRFNKTSILKKPFKIRCERKIENVSFTLVDNTPKKIGVSEITQNALYLVFLKLVWNSDYTRRIEQKRDYFKINFK